MNKLQQRALLFGSLCAGLCLLGIFVARPQFFISYLFAYMFWFGIAMGCFGISMLHHITGGAWGDLIRPQLNAAALTFPWLGLLFIPILCGMHTLYPWSRMDVVAADPVLQHKHLYLNIPFFISRAALDFTLWSWMAYRLNQWSIEKKSDLVSRRSAPGLVLFMLTGTFALFDWMMSIDPKWFSTIYGAMVLIGEILSAFAFTIFGLKHLQTPQDREDARFIKPYWDLGNLILAFVMLWAYMSFSQYLIIWSANLPEEIPWYLARQRGGWFIFVMLLVLLQFAMPFLLLLGRRNKQKIERLSYIALLLLIIGALSTFWLIVPSFYPGHFHMHWLDLAAFGAMGGFWVTVFISQLKMQPTLIGHYEPEVSHER